MWSCSTNGFLGKKKSKSNFNLTTSQNPFFPKRPSPKSILLLHFSTNRSEILKINVNLHFANTVFFGFLIQAPKKILSPKSKKTGFFLDFGLKFFSENFFETPISNIREKFSFAHILKVSEKFVEKCRSSILGDGHLGKIGS